MTNTPQRPNLPDHNQIIEQRYEKLAKLREEGVEPFPRRWIPTHSAKAANDGFDALVDAKTNVRAAGRIVGLRKMGKAAFIHLLDQTGKVQVHATADALGEAGFELVKKGLDLGDHVGAEGMMFATKTGEKTIAAEEIVLLSKAVRPPPEKWHGLKNTELRYRLRYVDMFANPETRDVFRTRARLVAAMRRELDGRGYLEVETPMMQPIYGGAAAKPFVTRHNALDTDLYLRIAPELYLKRLLVGGFEKVYEINRNFRNEGLSVRHNPEFTMMELYTAYWDYHDTMSLTEELIRAIATDLGLGETIPFGDHQISILGKAWDRMTVRESIFARTQIDLSWNMPRAEVLEKGAKFLVHLAPKERESASTARLIMAVFEEAVEKTLIQPTFITEFPAELSPLAKTRRDDTRVAERFELYVAGMELANAYSELNDPALQHAAFLQQLDARAGGDDEAHQLDEDYVRALEFGMPPASGLGIGVDRLAMILTNQHSIRDVVLFPLLRPEKHLGEHGNAHDDGEEKAGEKSAARVSATNAMAKGASSASLATAVAAPSMPPTFVPAAPSATTVEANAAAAAAPSAAGAPPARPNPEFSRIAPNVVFGKDVRIHGFVNLYGCSIGDETRVGAFVEIQKGASIGARCKISSHTFICEGVSIADEVFIGHGVCFINDKNPRAANADGSPQTEADWSCVPTFVERGASIGSGATILCGVTIGAGALVGAGAVVTHHVPPGGTVVGVPARGLKRGGGGAN
jgi:lysyl-tRNA synthetase class 2